jgi:hypothetical protein
MSNERIIVSKIIPSRIPYSDRLLPSSIAEQIKYVMRRLHCTNYEDHLWRYLSKSESIKNPCAWSKSHKLIADWLSTTEKSSKLFISGKPGTGKSVLTAHMINITKEEVVGHRGVLLYYFCGADSTVDQYSNVRQEASSQAIVMTFLRQIVSTYRHSIADLGEVVDYVSDSGDGMLSELGLRRLIVNLLESFDTVRCVYCLPLLSMLLSLAYFVLKGSSSTSIIVKNLHFRRTD